MPITRSIFLAGRSKKPSSTWLMGNSLGGLIAVELAETHPREFDGVVTLNGMVGGTKAQLDYVGNIRLLFRVNGALFLRGEGRTGPFGGPGGAGKASVTAEVLTTLNAGDYVEVVALRAGAAGTVTIDPDEAVFIAEVK